MANTKPIIGEGNAEPEYKNAKRGSRWRCEHMNRDWGKVMVVVGEQNRNMSIRGSLSTVGSADKPWLSLLRECCEWMVIELWEVGGTIPAVRLKNSQILYH